MWSIKRFFVFMIFIQMGLSKDAPVWPQQYYADGVFSIPYFKIAMPLKLNYDAVNNRERFDYYGHQDTYLYRYDLGMQYEIVPRIDTKVCFAQNSSGGPTHFRDVKDTPTLVTLLPDLTSWTYKGVSKVHNQHCDTWEKKVQNLNVTATYSMYLRVSDGYPVQLYLLGYDFVFGSHPDIYIMDFKTYKPNWVNQTSFDIPSLCNSPPENTRIGLRANSVLGMVATLSPPEEVDEFLVWAKANRKHYATKTEELYRRRVWESNKKMIEQHNAQIDKKHKLAMNKFGDMKQEEFKHVMMPKRNKIRSVQNNAKEHKVTGKQLPDNVNWVEQGAVNPPKDQGICGSCWTFGTNGAIEGAWFLKTGDLVSLAEQQLVDCAWVNWGGAGGNVGCDGGFASAAMDWVIQNGGMALESRYKYLMQDGWCRATDHSSGVVLKGYVNVTGEDNLMDAVGYFGPVAVAIDASHSDFTYYTSGVYYNPECKSDIDDLDHEVLVVGYGSTDDGEDYWLVKNSWSTHWGDKGFVKMARNRNNNCGIASQATYAIV